MKAGLSHDNDLVAVHSSSLPTNVCYIIGKSFAIGKVVKKPLDIFKKAGLY